MVVLAASIVSKNGKVLVSRQFANFTRIRIEGLLAAFPKLILGEKQHTFVEAENVRYVYQPLESLYVLLVTNKQSNILEDLETLRLLSKIIPEFCPTLEEEAISVMAFELTFAIDELISLGHRENVTMAQVKQYLEMESHEERLHKLVVQSKIDEAKDVMMRKVNEIDKNKLEKQRLAGVSYIPQSNGSGRYENGYQDSKSYGNGSSGSLSRFGSLDSALPKASARGSTPLTTPSSNGGMKLGKGQGTKQLLESLKAEGEDIIEDTQTVRGPLKTASVAATEPLTVSIEEKLNVTLKADGGVENFELQGTMTLVVYSDEYSKVHLELETASNENVQMKTHPRIDRDSFMKSKIVCLKNASSSFPVGTPLEVLKWRLQRRDESLIPLSINCWTSVSQNECLVNIEYEASNAFELKNVLVTIPLPALRDVVAVNQVDGDWRYDSRKSILEWSILLIDDSNRSGSLEFVVPTSDMSVFYPIDVKFSASKFLCNVKLAGVIDVNTGNHVKHGGQTQLSVESYQVV